MKYVSIDLETTGLDPEKHNIIEFGAVIDDLDDPKPINQLPKFHAYILPPCNGKEYTGTCYALSMHSKIFLKIDAYLSKKANPNNDNFYMPELLGDHLLQFLMLNGIDCRKVNAAGKNFAGFDLPFLKYQTNVLDSVRFKHRVIDPAILYFNHAEDKDGLPNTETCIQRMNKQFNLHETETVSHTAIDDAITVIKLIRKKIYLN